jgi:Holliday junction resolvase
MPNPESKIQTAIIRYIKSIPASYVLRPITCTEAGHPDIVCLIQGIMFGIEVKQPGKKPTALQKKRLEQIEGAGGCGIVAHSVDDVRKWFAKRGVSAII